jgi:hypothetical protein
LRGARHALDCRLNQCLRQLDAMEDTAAQKGVREPAFFIAGGDNDRRPPTPWANHLARIEWMRKAVLVELVQEIIREIAWRLVDLVDQHHRVALGFVCFPQRPLV